MRKPHALRTFWRTPWGRFLFTRDPGSSDQPSDLQFQTHLGAVLRRGDGSTRTFDLGSGKVTNVGVMAMSYDWQWAQNAQTLKLANYHACGIGTTPEAQTDIALQTPAYPTTATAVTGTQATVTAANSQTYESIATINFTTIPSPPTAVTEWGLFSAAALSAATGSPATAVSATTLTATATPYAASSGSVQGQQQHIVKTGTTASYGLIISNTTSILTLASNVTPFGWWKVSDGTVGTQPGGTEAFAILPVMWDHKTFTAISVNNGDAIQFTYTLVINSNG
jgi:hypothetical protein